MVESRSFVPCACGGALPTGTRIQPFSRQVAPVRTYSPKASEITRDWWIIDAEGMVLGRLATEVARVLRGKHKPTFTPHLDMGDHVIIVNADKVVLTAGKADRKVVWHHSGFPGGIKSRSYGEALDRDAAKAVYRTVKGMLPKTRLGNQMATKLKVYVGPDHPHSAQKPRTLEIDARAKARVS